MNKTLNTNEAAQYLKVSTNTLANWRSQGKDPTYYRARGKVIYYKDDLDAWIKSEDGELNE